MDIRISGSGIKSGLSGPWYRDLEKWEVLSCERREGEMERRERGGGEMEERESVCVCVNGERGG